VKQKDIVYLILAVVIMLVAGYVGYTQIVPKKAGAKTVEVEKVGVIPDHLDEKALDWLSDSTRVRDFGSPVDLSGLDNAAPFGQ
jgi:hypothetical protein